MTVGFIGLGLIGGSIAKAIRERHPDTIIKAYNRSQDVLKEAISDDVVDVSLPSYKEGFSDCDIIFLCLPVVTAAEILPSVAPQLKEGAILTDVGSTKTLIHRAVEAAGIAASFIGGHPMTGSEKSGYRYSQALLLENAYYMLTPTEEVSHEKADSFRELIASLGALPVILSYEEHDRVVAAISHLPHLISASLVNLVKDSDSDRHLMKTVAAGGFRDITRISSSSPEMWREICLANGDAILPLLDRYIALLSSYREAVSKKDADALYQIFESCKAYRDSFQGLGRREYRLYSDIADEEGAIARIATLLADHNISLKNIGIVHNREDEPGVLKISFYERNALARAVRTLKGSGYTVYED